MARPREENPAVCQNKKCKYYLKEKGKDIIRRGSQSGHQRYYCNHCETYFTETNGTLMYRKHMSEDEVIEICKHLVEKNGIRSIERLTGHHRDTVGNLLQKLGEHARQANEILIKNLHWGPIELDEMWTFLKKRKKDLTPKAISEIKLAMHGSMMQ